MLEIFGIVAGIITFPVIIFMLIVAMSTMF